MKVKILIFGIVLLMFASLSLGATEEIVLFKDECNTGTPSTNGWTAGVSYNAGNCEINAWAQYSNHANISVNNSVNWTLSISQTIDSQMASTNLAGFGFEEAFNSGTGFQTWNKGNSDPTKWYSGTTDIGNYGTFSTGWHVFEYRFNTVDEKIYVYENNSLIKTTTAINSSKFTLISLANDHGGGDVRWDWINLTYTNEIVETVTLNISSSLPENNTQFNTELLSLNLTANASLDFNCSLYLDSTLNQTNTGYTSGNNIPVNFSLNFDSSLEQTFIYYINCYDENYNKNSTTNTFSIVKIYQYYSCFNGSEWYELNSSNGNQSGFYEEAMWWKSEDYPEDITLDTNQDGINDINILGKLIGTNIFYNYFYSNDTKYTVLNLTRNTAGTKTVYMNTTTVGFDRSSTPISNFTFKLNGFNLDIGNTFESTENFENVSNVGGSYGENISLMSAIQDFEDNDTSKWTQTHVAGTSGSMSIQDVGTNAYLQMSLSFGCGDGSCPQGYGGVETQWTEELENFDLRKVNYFQTNLYREDSYSCSTGSYIYYYNNIYLTDGNNSVELWSDDSGTINCVGGTSGSGSSWFNLSGNRTGDFLSIYHGDTYQNTVDLSSLNDLVKPYFKIRSRFDWSSSNRYSRSYSSSYKLYNINVSGISIKMIGSNYSNISSYNYTSPILNFTPNNIQRARLTVNDIYLPSNTSVTYYLSNDNGTTWEDVLNDTYNAFTSTGKNISARFELETTNKSLSPIVHSYSVNVDPTAVSGIYVDVGADGENDWNYTGTLNTTNSPQNFSTNGSSFYDYITDNCPDNTTCYVPLVITFGTPGVVEISDLNLTLNANPVTVPTSNIENDNLIELAFKFVNGSIDLSNLALDYLGSKNITFFAHFFNNVSINVSHTMQVKYSNFNVSLPANISYWEVFPKTKDSKNITPYGQTNTTSIWNITSQAYDDSFDTYVFVNETVNSCMNISFSNNSVVNSSDLKINTSIQQIYAGVTPLTGSFGIWNSIDLNNCTSRFYMPYFSFTSICSDCVKVSGWEDQVNLIQE